MKPKSSNSIASLATTLVTTAAITLGGVAVASSAGLLSDAPLAPDNGWEFSMTPYVWALFITGDQTAGNNTADINTNLFEIIDDSDEVYGFMSYQELRKGGFGLFADVYWSKVNTSGTDTANLQPIPGLNVNTVIGSNINVETMIIEPGAAFEIFNSSSGGSAFNSPARATAIDFLAGARYWYVRPDIALNVDATVNIPALDLTHKGAGRVAGTTTIDWWDPYVGLRMRHQRGPGQELTLRGDVGGFGGGSDFTWQLQGSYDFATTFLGYDMVAHVGYRALYVDYSEGNGRETLGFDWLWHGPTMGAKFTW